MDSKEIGILGKVSADIESMRRNLQMQRTENREDHATMFRKLDALGTRVTMVEKEAEQNTEDIEKHSNGHWKWYGAIITTGGVISGIVGLVVAIL